MHLTRQEAVFFDRYMTISHLTLLVSPLSPVCHHQTKRLQPGGLINSSFARHRVRA